MVKIELEEWQVKNLRNYFGENDKTQTAHWAYEVFNKALKKQCDIPVVLECKHDFEPYYNWCSELAGYRCEKCGEEKD